MSGWSGSLNELEQGGGGRILRRRPSRGREQRPSAARSSYRGCLREGGRIAKLPYHHAYDPWNGLVSALAWVDRMHAASAIARLLETPRPRTRWLGVAACGARRSVQQPGLEASLADPEPMVRARAACTMGELGRSDTRSLLHALLADQDEDCRYWAAWSGARLGTSGKADRALAELDPVRRGPGAEAASGLLAATPADRPRARFTPARLAGNPRQRWNRGASRRRSSAISAPTLPWLIDQTKDGARRRTCGRGLR